MKCAVRLIATIPCNACDGSGVDPTPDDFTAPCTACDGRGGHEAVATCATCCHWVARPNACMRPTIPGALFYPGYESSFYTKPEFGCAQWEPRESKPV
jgi:hypothetical protein